MAGTGGTVMKNLVNQAVKDKVGVSKVIDSFNEVYDYIIVGAGAAGNVLANRLSENSIDKVLLVEEGGDDVSLPDIHIPTMTGELQQTDFTHNYKTVPQRRACRGMNEQKASIPRGRGLGGSSSINYMTYTRGSRYDYDEWAELGCKGWSYRDVLPYFIKSEGNTNPELAKSPYHGTDGPMKISDLELTPLVQAFLDAGKELGYSMTDINGPNQLGFCAGQGHLYEGMRWSTAHGYLRPAMDRHNLHVAIESEVKQLLFKKNRVTGVEIEKNNERVKVKANKEVILAAGAIESPRLLMLSGIGPREQLEKLNIPVRANLPVGNNLQDHPTCVIEYLVDRPPSINVDQALQNKSNQDYQQLLFFKSGYLGTAGAQGALAFFRSRYCDRDKLYPDVYIHMSCSLFGGVFKRNWNLKQEVWESLYEPDEESVNKHHMYLTSMLLHPYSTGTVKLNPKDPQGAPLIDPRFLDDPRDSAVLKEGMKLQLQLNHSDSFQQLQVHPTHKTFPGWKRETLYSDSYLEKYVRHHTLSGHHASGTCKMGRINDSTSVVDPQLKVIGFEGLRVVDASILPNVPSGNTGAPTIMVAEKAADLIRGVSSIQDIKLPQEVEEELEKKEKKYSR